MADVLLTGATGFVGKHVAERLRRENVAPRIAVRTLEKGRVLGADAELVAVGPVGSQTDWSVALHGIQTVIHLAARAHILEERAADPLAAFLEVNTLGTLRLATLAAQSGVRRFIFLSSVKVNGESSGLRGFAASDPPAPVDPYGVSKLRAEQGLVQLASETGMEIVIVRPPLIYGPGVGANFLRLVRLVDRGIPLPVGAVRNERSLVSIWNLCDLLVVCLQAPAAANRTFMVSDGHDLSTAGLVRQLAKALGRKPRIVNVPPSLLGLAARLTGQMAEYTRLCGSLKIDMTDTIRTLEWRPAHSIEQSIARTVEWYRMPR